MLTSLRLAGLEAGHLLDLMVLGLLQSMEEPGLLLTTGQQGLQEEHELKTLG